MAIVRSGLVRKLARVLKKRFPPPVTVEIEDDNGIIGVITSDSFLGMDGMDHQELIGDILAEKLTKAERQQVQIIVDVTPKEGTGYLASAE
jgi:hypothetical protein